MATILARRRAIRAHVEVWSAEAQETYGDKAEEVLRRIERRHSGMERYALMLVRKAIQRQGRRSSYLFEFVGGLADIFVKGPTVGSHLRSS